MHFRLPERFIAEIEILQEGTINIGVAMFPFFITEDTAEWNTECIRNVIWLYECRESNYTCKFAVGEEEQYGEPMRTKDIIRMEYNYQDELIFYRNGKSLGVAFNLHQHFYLFFCLQHGSKIKILSIKKI